MVKHSFYSNVDCCILNMVQICQILVCADMQQMSVRKVNIFTM